MTPLEARDQVVLHMVDNGQSLRQIQEATGYGQHAVQELVRAVRGCAHGECGRHRSSPGRPRAGWIKVAQTQNEAVWFCSWPCAARYCGIQARAV